MAMPLEAGFQLVSGKFSVVLITGDFIPSFT